MNALWNEIASAVENGREGPKIDLKREITLDGKSDKAEFAKDVSAIANTSGGVGYIILGVVDVKHRASNNPKDYIKGFCLHNADKIEQQMQQALSNYVEPPPIFEFQAIVHPKVNRTLGLIIIHESLRRPHMFIRGSGDIEQRDILIRRGSHTCKAGREEILEMSRDYWQDRIEDERIFWDARYQEVSDDVAAWQNISLQACRRLYHALSKDRRGKVVKEILSQFGKEDYFERWFADN